MSTASNVELLTEPAAGAWVGAMEASGGGPAALVERSARRLIMMPTDGQGRTREVMTSLLMEGTKEGPACEEGRGTMDNGGPSMRGPP